MQDKCFFFFLVLKNWVIVQPKFAKRRSHKVSRFGKVIRRNFKFFLKKHKSGHGVSVTSAKS